ncbi:uncharacterized protein DI49_1876 [Saccharomyces eubayanus]|uniref:uncharacterized protein n=1 Tax=Saccharomyces eubayanus TaxID=1080349 RepID=UPI0006C4228C|nr:hypothetical protein DI49_1876 [Saccharomyces eubayanus]KOG99422.1 hypothetical protein DI49_1876 [Saccharomyces eubayanus]
MTEPAPSYSKKKILYELYYGFRPNKPTYTPDDYPNLTGKTAIVTGANTGIGLHVAKILYEKNCDVIIVVRTAAKGEKARDEIVAGAPDSKGSVIIADGCDFLDLNTVKPTANKIKTALGDKPLNVIIHNAGLMSPINTGISKQGIEAMFQVNDMGPQLLQHFLDPLFLKKDSDLKRIVWVSSASHLIAFREYGINWENPGFEGVDAGKRPAAAALYGQSKAANIMQAKAWSTKNKTIVDEIGCVSVSCYPGNLNTDLTRDWNPLLRKIGGYLFWDGKYGAYTELYGALSPALTTKDQGAYVVPFGEIHDPREDIKAALANGTDLKLWNLIEEKISKYF